MLILPKYNCKSLSKSYADFSKFARNSSSCNAYVCQNLMWLSLNVELNKSVAHTSILNWSLWMSSSLNLLQTFETECNFWCKCIWIQMLNLLSGCIIAPSRKLEQFWDHLPKLEELYLVLIKMTDPWSFDLNCDLENLILNWNSCLESKWKTLSKCESKSLKPSPKFRIKV